MANYILVKDWHSPDSTIKKGAKFKRIETKNGDYEYELIMDDSFIEDQRHIVFWNKKLNKVDVEGNKSWFIKENDFINDAVLSWVCIERTQYGCAYEKSDGSIIVTGSWDGNGMKYDVHFKGSQYSH